MKGLFGPVKWYWLWPVQTIFSIKSYNKCCKHLKKISFVLIKKEGCCGLVESAGMEASTSLPANRSLVNFMLGNFEWVSKKYVLLIIQYRFMGFWIFSLGTEMLASIRIGMLGSCFPSRILLFNFGPEVSNWFRPVINSSTGPKGPML